ncbi:MAG TPA: 2-oxoglutarate dehydrogenase E1 component [Terrimicrobiaceae bacterium]|nr:2-oxoglutarate dehydrogenase E1 component [Terrimicrobiaceae bacterium]
MSTFTARWSEGLIDDNYERWRSNPQSVDPDWAAFFEGFELGFAKSEENGETATAEPTPGTLPDSSLQTRVEALVYAYRTLGHTIADLDPLDLLKRSNPLLSLKELGFEERELDLVVSSRFFKEGKKMKLRDMIRELEANYCGTVGAEFMHIQNPRMRTWVLYKLEHRDASLRANAAVHRDILQKLYEAETFENFLHTKYGGKRFSLEGGEALILALDTIVQNCERRGIKEIVMGMSHRGRLNVLANVLNKPLDVIFNEFQGTFAPDSVGGNGDVKYHLGYRNVRKTATGYEVEINLAANPSHLEAVDPVVEGKARARQRVLDDTAYRKKVVPILIHGDAAFIGQGVVAETFNMSQLPGYSTGGTIHFVVNNQIGFTTLPADSRSSEYCTEIAKMVDAPIFHVNGEDPIAVMEMSKIALEFRHEFGRDVVVDIYCYRRHGHNEGDEPAFTQPDLYNRIKNHALPSEVFLNQIASLGTVSAEEAAALKADSLKELNDALSQVKLAAAEKAKAHEFAGSTAIFQPHYSHAPITTAITKETLDTIAKTLTTVPEDFRVLPKIKRILLERRLQVWKSGGPYNWSFAEALAFGSLLLEGTPVRLSGQDSRRGTFSQRHSVLYDEDNRQRYIPLNHLRPNQARFCVYNSPLSEYAVLGFDYGYSMDFPSQLYLWEAQFGDFANGAQIIVDQFIASSESKWRRPSAIVLLLPHGYEGQGPEHSSARLERFLQLCAEENMQVCYPTTPAQYFHVLRRQMHRKYRKPLILMTPKSLLTHEQAVSTESDFTGSRFFEVLADSEASAKKVERVIFCSGKVYYDLVKYRKENNLTDAAAIIRIEQLYPLYKEKIARLTKPLINAKKFIWCQEEPENMGAWTFILPQLLNLFPGYIHYAGRPASASPAAGTIQAHQAQQAALVKQAFEV